MFPLDPSSAAWLAFFSRLFHRARRSATRDTPTKMASPFQSQWQEQSGFPLTMYSVTVTSFMQEILFGYQKTRTRFGDRTLMLLALFQGYSSHSSPRANVQRCMHFDKLYIRLNEILLPVCFAQYHPPLSPVLLVNCIYCCIKNWSPNFLAFFLHQSLHPLETCFWWTQTAPIRFAKLLPYWRMSF